jgi:hypothetical protein
VIPHYAERLIATPWFDYLLAAPPLLRELTTGTPWTVTAVHVSDAVNYLAVLARALPGGFVTL